ncbi:MAG: acyl-CoA dehydrogenase [Rhodoferax sp.]|nr:acyl-CoA dehydrogenase [Rhodoferax sp.]
MKLEDWIGRTELREDDVTPVPWAALAATLDCPLPGTGLPTPDMSLPALWHWLYFLPLAPQSELGPDGHPRRGGFLPPVALPRRMWAGGELDFVEPLRLGDRLERQSTIEAVTPRTGRSRALVFVTVRHDIRRQGASTVALRERHHIVYRDAPAAGDASPPTPAPQQARWRQDRVPDAVLLFRYSALTFNGHRIHYDHRHATQAEGYPGLVVHGPLIATLLLQLLQREQPDAGVRSFRFQALRPAFDGQRLTLRGEPDPDGRSVRLWASDAQDALCMQAQARLD